MLWTVIKIMTWVGLISFGFLSMLVIEGTIEINRKMNEEENHKDVNF